MPEGQTVAMLRGPRTDEPVVLLKTWKPWLTIWTYCVAPTSPFVSGGAQLQVTPGNGMPSKLSVGAGMFGLASCRCTTGSTAFRGLAGNSGLRLASCSDRHVYGARGIVRRAGVRKCETACPTIGLAEVLANALGLVARTACEWPNGDAPASTTPVSTRTAAATAARAIAPLRVLMNLGM